MYQYKNKNGDIFEIITTEESTIAYCCGSYIAQAETETELEKILNRLSHHDYKTTKHYLGIGSKKTAH